MENEIVEGIPGPRAAGRLHTTIVGRKATYKLLLHLSSKRVL